MKEDLGAGFGCFPTRNSARNPGALGRQLTSERLQRREESQLLKKDLRGGEPA